MNKQNNSLVVGAIFACCFLYFSFLYAFYVGALWGYKISNAEISLLHNDMDGAIEKIQNVGKNRAGMNELIEKIEVMEKEKTGIQAYSNGDIGSALEIFTQTGNNDYIGLCGVYYYEEKDYYNARKCFEICGGYEDYMKKMAEDRVTEAFFNTYQIALEEIEKGNYKEAVKCLKIVATHDFKDSRELLDKYEKLVDS